MNNKGKRFFNIIITITVIALIGLIGFLSYYYISNYITLKQAEEAVDNFEEEVIDNSITVDLDDIEDINNNTNTQTQAPNKTPTSNKNTTSKYKGYSMAGTIQIPKTKVKIPVVDKVTTTSIAAAAGVLYGPGLNEVGNTVLVAHNYRNGTYFSNNKKLVAGDKIYITDSKGRKIEYTIYNIYIASDTEFDYATRNTNGKREISLSTCTTDVTKRLVIWAKET